MRSAGEATTIPPKALAAEPPRGADDVMADPERRAALAEEFMGEFVGSGAWQAMLAVLEGAFPGLGLAARLNRGADMLWEVTDVLDRGSGVRLGVPVWLDDAGMVLDLSAHRTRRPDVARPQPRTRASWPYAGAFVIDTLDPLRYHRAVGGPLAPGARPGRPREGALSTSPPGEDDDTGVVIVGDLTAAGARILDSAALWRYAGRVVAAALHDPARPDSRARARRALRALRRVVVVDPNLGLGLCLRIDTARTPRCLLAFSVDRDGTGAPRFLRP
ncbi:hypothetical protein ABZ801_36420 [Actinomadura sp. NPDC047616]|uniref:hypothetical protein n=1 Tax=Actinomadura sp. NPDC047616 TaxID=3155914 RepID=UPI003404D721